MPDWAKEVALDVIPKLNFEEFSKNQYIDFEKVIKTNVIHQQNI